MVIICLVNRWRVLFVSVCVCFPFCKSQCSPLTSNQVSFFLHWRVTFRPIVVRSVMCSLARISHGSELQHLPVLGVNFLLAQCVHFWSLEMNQHISKVHMDLHTPPLLGDLLSFKVIQKICHTVCIEPNPCAMLESLGWKFQHEQNPSFVLFS